MTLPDATGQLPEPVPPTYQAGPQQAPPYPDHSPAAGAAPQSRKLLWIGLAGGFPAGLVTAFLGSAVAGAIAAAGAPSFEEAAETCNVTHVAGINVGDNGTSITIDTKGSDDSSGASMDDAACILNALDVPDSVISQMDDTSAMDGRQTASWAGVDASWTYHPDSGVKLILTEAKG